MKNKIYKNWTLIDWDGNRELNLKCWRKSFRKGHVSVGVGAFENVVFSYGANSDNSYSSTRWNYDKPVITEAEAMEAVDKSNGFDMNSIDRSHGRAYMQSQGLE